MDAAGQNRQTDAFASYLDNTYYPALPNSIKNAITERNTFATRANPSDDSSFNYAKHNVWNMSYVERWGESNITVTYDKSSFNQQGRPKTPEKNRLSQFPYYFANSTKYDGRVNGAGGNTILRSNLYIGANLGSYVAIAWTTSNATYLTASRQAKLFDADQTTGFNVLPCMMIASDPIE
jgi:hypothetical protein